MSNKYVRVFGAFMLFAVLIFFVKGRTLASRQDEKDEKAPKHSKLYHDQSREKLTDLANTKEKGKYIRRKTDPGIEVSPSETGPSLLNMFCVSDIAVMGTIQSAKSYLSEDETDVFTLFEISIQEVLQNSDAHAISPHSTLLVSKGGGKVDYNGRTIETIDENGRGMVSQGERYLLFLKYLPEIDSYRVVDTAYFFINAQDKVHVNRKMANIRQGDNNADEFLQIARLEAARAAGCRRKGN